ncbi:conserved hypothetical protein [Verticillium alfalfae VaMs.102]|uniref:Rab-GAP TBC domain-containing protein n=1 Tax=Verticillium alfalfae (strain VaMs.102 / ATCC MYA-4576 / FGSC 10136) TaxID=526221 RepID=C9SCS7_VERA1|nr:conserved hypothetical protein [Verticillium alfalfae VaMs.102]EEY16892.1 conserved hypothetical protein [Verticillium alfalfae VaMs.102]
MPTATNTNSLRATRHKPSALMPLPLSVTSIFSDVVAFRYENTVQAEPPILMPPRSLAGTAPTSPNTSTTNLASSRRTSVTTTRSAPRPPTSPCTSSPRSPPTSPSAARNPPSRVVVVAPPNEQHPALRSLFASRDTSIPPEEAWKRDSGLARTTSSTTLFDEDEDDEDRDKLHDIALYDKHFEAGVTVTTAPTPSPPSLHDTESVYSTDDQPEHPSLPSPLPIACVTSSTVSSIAGESAPPPPSAPTPARRLIKSLSLRTLNTTKRFQRNKQLSLSEETSPISATSSAAPMPLLSRGSAACQGQQHASPVPHHNLHDHPSSPASTSEKSPNLSPVAVASSPAPHLPADAPADPDFSPLSIAIPNDAFLDDDFLSNLSFSQRGSVMFSGRRAVSQPTDSTMEAEGDVHPPPTAVSQKAHSEDVASPSIAMTTTTATSDTALETASQTTTTPSIRLLSPEAEKDSQKVRSLYESGDVINWEDGGRLSPLGEQNEPVPSEELENDPVSELQPPLAWPTPRSATSSSSRPEQQDARREHERAGGIEDWEDIDNADVDRYGFIAPPRNPDSRVGTPTELKSAQYAPRRRNLLMKRDPSGGLSSHLGAGGRSPSRKVSARSLNTQNSGLSVRSRRSTRSAIRQASNYLPHNRNRRWMDEAGDMLTLAPGMEDEEKVEKISEAIKKKEWERSEKWRKMAKVVKQGKDGEGMYFEFDVKNPKLIERTWKGIPDRWRASAWYSFLATSARGRKDSAPEEDIIAAFRRYQDIGSPDDVQIDLDVPRTINRHIMFRRRYRGGQRLLFRVLHALSLYFPDVGYVQGMASLAATLLCYFDEEKCFVMLVRMWQLRGLEALYQPGFEGLMGALRGILRTQRSSASGTFSCFLGEAAPEQRPMTAKSAGPPSAALPVMGIDIVHATSAALISALGEVLLDSDFENAMKALTSWIPIKDEDLLMKVTKAEWRAQQGKKRA